MAAPKTTERQFIAACTEGRAQGKTWQQIADGLGVTTSNLHKRRARLIERGEDLPPLVAGNANPLAITGTSTLKRRNVETGQVEDVIWWEKTGTDKQAKAAQFESLLTAMCEELKGLAKPVKAPAVVDADYCNVIPYGDPHVGLYAWAAEAGDDFDLAIAEQVMVGAILELLDRMPKAQQAVLINLGDFFHADSQTNATPTSQHALDVDSRWPKIQQAGSRIMRRIINALLTKHSKVLVKCVRGNHDPHAGYTLAMILDAFYDGDPRVTVDLSPGAFWYLLWGNTLMGACHGHTVKKIDDLAAIMATDVPELWGKARHRRWFRGHEHHSEVKELRGCTVETFRTLAPADAYAQSHGYRSDRSLDCITIHKELGERMRSRVFFEQAMDRAA